MKKMKKTRKLKKSLIPDREGLIESEKVFSRKMDVYNLKRLQNPIDLFLKVYKYEKLKKSYKKKERLLFVYRFLEMI